MAKEFSFDVVSKADLNEVRNAVNMAQKEIATRYDFKKSVSSVTLEGDALVLVSDNDGKLKQVVDVLEEKLVRRKVPLKAIQYGKVEEALGGTVRQHAPIAQGIPDEKAKAMNKLIRQRFKKVKVQIQGDTPARVLGQQGRASGRHGRPARRGLGHPRPVRELPLRPLTGSSFFIQTLGCPKNEADSDALEARLRAAGHSPAAPGRADVVVVNTCGFIDAAKEESIEAILDAAEAAHARGARVAAVGCLVERYRDELAAELPEVDLWCGLDTAPLLAALGEAGGEAARASRPAPPCPYLAGRAP